MKIGWGVSDMWRVENRPLPLTRSMACTYKPWEALLSTGKTVFRLLVDRFVIFRSAGPNPWFSRSSVRIRGFEANTPKFEPTLSNFFARGCTPCVISMKYTAFSGRQFLVLVASKIFKGPGSKTRRWIKILGQRMAMRMQRLVEIA